MGPSVGDRSRVAVTIAPPAEEECREEQASTAAPTAQGAGLLKASRASRYGAEKKAAAAAEDSKELDTLERSSVVEQGIVEVTLRGLKINSTVRGKPVHEMNEDVSSAKGKRKNDDVKYLDAQQVRLKLERTLALEEYHERKLEERIRTLEHMRDAEIENQEDTRLREKKRERRRAELEAELAAKGGYQAHLEQEDREREARQEAAESADRAWREKDAQLKRELAKWRQDNPSDETFTTEHVRHRKAELEAAHLEALRNRAEARLQTVQRKDADSRVFRQRVAVEQRPPMPPVTQDFPKPVLDSAAGLRCKPPAAASAQNSAAGHAQHQTQSWASQSKAVAEMYGLSPREQAEVTCHLTRGVAGAGRMAQARPGPRKGSPAPAGPLTARG